MAFLVTGAAGFIGFHTCLQLLDRDEIVIGLDLVNNYYDPTLKEARLSILNRRSNFTFYRVDIADREVMTDLAVKYPKITKIIHLAAQVGVRYSLINPYAYTHSNIDGFLNMLEFARLLKSCEHFVYASSSSVYGKNVKLPFAVGDNVDTPVSIYAATKIANELMAHSYNHLFFIPTIGLRFFTVYGPWGRPDMAVFLFVKSIIDEQPIRVFNGGEMRRDFTYIDDVVRGIFSIFYGRSSLNNEIKFPIYNIGNNRSESLMRLIDLIERAVGRKAKIILEPMQPCDVVETFADITEIKRDYGFEPTTCIEDGIPKFVKWYKSYYKI
ncbi:MAG: GDP-mannose 4,6-dehydratase [Rhodospirillaceae bacterium]|jgi:UDP-glucuronate 4-epimerase|nr:GDP-mannose 4,6-dehydratase [Rhodospirillaceae bacterium]